MRRSRIGRPMSVPVLFVLALGTTLLWGFTTDVAALERLAPTSPVSPQVNITFNFPSASFFSGGGGGVFGSATLAGNIRGTELSRLRGSLNLPLKDYTLAVDPTEPLQLSTFLSFVSWFDPSTGQSGFAAFSVTTARAPVDLHFASFHGLGTLSFLSSSSCVSGQCPPPGAFLCCLPGSTLTGAVGSPQDAGTLSLFGPAPTIE